MGRHTRRSNRGPYRARRGRNQIRGGLRGPYRASKTLGLRGETSALGSSFFSRNDASSFRDSSLPSPASSTERRYFSDNISGEPSNRFLGPRKPFSYRDMTRSQPMEVSSTTTNSASSLKHFQHPQPADHSQHYSRLQNHHQDTTDCQGSMYEDSTNSLFVIGQDGTLQFVGHSHHATDNNQVSSNQGRCQSTVNAFKQVSLHRATSAHMNNKFELEKQILDGVENQVSQRGISSCLGTGNDGRRTLDATHAKTNLIAHNNDDRREHLFKMPNIPSAWLQVPMTQYQANRFRSSVCTKEKAVDRLAYKIFYQLFLSPVFGISDDALSTVSQSLSKLPHVASGPGQIVASLQHLPPQLERLLTDEIGTLFGNHALDSSAKSTNTSYHLTQPGTHTNRESAVEQSGPENDWKEYREVNASVARSSSHDPNEKAFDVLADNIRYCFENVFVRQADGNMPGQQSNLQVIRGRPFPPQRSGAPVYKSRQLESAESVCVDPLYRHIMHWMHPDYSDPFQ